MTLKIVRTIWWLANGNWRLVFSGQDGEMPPARPIRSQRSTRVVSKAGSHRKEERMQDRKVEKSGFRDPSYRRLDTFALFCLTRIYLSSILLT